MKRVVLTFVFLLATSAAVSDELTRRLPPIDATESEFAAPIDWQPYSNELNIEPLPAGRAVGGNPNSQGNFPEPLLGEDQLALPPVKLSPYKQGFFQKLSFTATWLDGGRDNDLGITELRSFITVALPLPTRDHPLFITPNFDVRFLNGPLTPDLPARIYSAYAQFIWVPKLSDRVQGIIGIEPGIYGDFQNSGADSFRLLGRGLVRFQWIPDHLELIAGVLYLDRDDIALLPAGGIIWSPNDSMRYEIIFPQPKFAHRISWDGRVEHWVYLSGEFGGDTWAIQRTDGSDDRLTLRDIRVMLGLERKLDGGAGARVEVGYVFSRLIEYSSATPDVNLPATFMLRGGITF